MCANTYKPGGKDKSKRTTRRNLIWISFISISIPVFINEIPTIRLHLPPSVERIGLRPIFNLLVTTSLTSNNCTLCPHCIFKCFVFI